MAIERTSTYGTEQDYLSSSRATGTMLRALKTQGQSLYPNSRSRIEICRAALAGTLKAPIPTDIAKDIVDAVRVRHATSITTPLQLANVLARKRPVLERYSVAFGRSPDDVASEIKVYANAALELPTPMGFPWADVVEILLNEGEVGLIVAPKMAHWEGKPQRYDADGNTVDFEAYRDRKLGRGGSSNRRKNGARAYAAEEDAQLARKFPVVIRAISPLNCYPFFGSGGNLTGLLVWSMYSAIEMIRAGYIWDGMQRHLQPTGNSLGMQGEVEVLEWWSTDLDGDPYVSYAIEGAKTANLSRSDDPDGRTATINLRKECGLTRLPVSYEYGQHFSTSNLDDRSVPFAWPYVRQWLAADALATATVYAGWRNGFLSFAVKRDPLSLTSSAAATAGLERSNPRVISIAPNKIIEIDGELIPLRHEGVGPDVMNMLNHLLQTNKEAGPPDAAFGGEAPSMADRSLSRKYVEDSMAHTVEASRRLYEFAGETVLETCWAIGTKYRPVPLAVNTEVPPDQGGEPSPTRAIVTLDPKLLGSPAVFDLKAEWPHVPGENLATAQQWIGFVEQGGMLMAEFRKLGMGDSNPQVFAARKVVEDYYASPEGRADLLAYAAKKLADKALAAKFEMQEKGQLNAEGVPPGMLAGVGQPPQDGLMPAPAGVVPGTAIGNPAASQLGAIAGAGISGGMRLAGAADGTGGMGPGGTGMGM